MEQQIPVKVAIRCRPLIKKERLEGCQASVQADPEGKTITMRGDSRVYTFDWTFTPTAPQVEIYEACLQGKLEEVFKGYNLTVLAYGQTGSGKTHTMGTEPSMMTFDDRDTWGLIPRYVADLFDGAKERQDLFSVKVTTSFLEIYNEKVFDLLAPLEPGRERRELLIRENTEGIVLPDLVKAPVKGLEDVMRLLERGSSVRSKGATAMNESSSRSHAVFSLYVTIVSRDDDSNIVSAKCHLVDLAGSERLDKTMATGTRKREGININVGLFHLGGVIEALTPAEGKSSRNPLKHVPYRNHNLTRLLQDSLGGNSHTIFLACVSPADSNIDETINTLKYAEKASRIKNKPVVNRDPVTAELMRLRQENLDLRQALLEGGGGSGGGKQTGKEVAPIVEAPSRSDQASAELNDQLKAQIKQLSKEVSASGNTQMRMTAELVKVEGKYDRLKEKLEAFSQETQKSIDLLSSTHFDPEEKSRQLGQFRRLFDELQHLQEDNDVITEDQTGVVGSGDEDGDDNMETNTTDEFAEAKQGEKVKVKTAQLNDMNKLILDKQEVMEEAMKNDVGMKELQEKHAQKVRELEGKIVALEHERDHSSSSSMKVGEIRRKRLIEVETELKEAKKTLKEAQLAQKLKAQNAKEIKKLQEEIKAMKTSRVKLMNQVKQEEKKLRIFKQKNELELNQLKQKEKKREFEVIRERREHEKQMAVQKQKCEQTTALLRRLQNQQLQQRQAAQTKLADANDSEKMVTSLKVFLSRELDLIVGAEEARLQRDELMQQRKQLVADMNRLNKNIDKMNLSLNTQGEPTAKRRKSEFDAEELKRCQAQVVSMNVELAKMNQQIFDLQKESSEGETDEKEIARVNKFMSLPQARCALKILFAMAVEAKIEWTKAGREMGSLRAEIFDLNEKIDTLKTSLAESKSAWSEEIRQLNEKITEVQRAKVVEMALVLAQVKQNPADGAVLNDINLNQVELVETLSANLEEKAEESKGLKMELSKANMQGRRTGKLFPAPRRSANRTANRSTSGDTDDLMEEKQTTQRTRSNRLSRSVVRYGSAVTLQNIDDESESESTAPDDGDGDSSFRNTPMGKHTKRLTMDIKQKKKRKLPTAVNPNETFTKVESDEEEEKEEREEKFVAPTNPPAAANITKLPGISPSTASSSGMMRITPKQHQGSFFKPLSSSTNVHKK